LGDEPNKVSFHVSLLKNVNSNCALESTIV
jgi:hypothetical protein